MVFETFGFPMVKSWKFGFRKLREVCRIHFHLVAPPKTAVVPSYDPKTEKVKEYQINEYDILSVVVVLAVVVVVVVVVVGGSRSSRSSCSSS